MSHRSSRQPAPSAATSVSASPALRAPDMRLDEEDLLSLSCQTTGRPCQLAPVPDGATMEIVVRLSQERRPIQVCLTHVPADACVVCGAISVDVTALAQAERALTLLLQETPTEQGLLRHHPRQGRLTLDFRQVFPIFPLERGEPAG